MPVENGELKYRDKVSLIDFIIKRPILLAILTSLRFYIPGYIFNVRFRGFVNLEK